MARGRPEAGARRTAQPAPARWLKAIRLRQGASKHTDLNVCFPAIADIHKLLSIPFVGWRVPGKLDAGLEEQTLQAPDNRTGWLRRAVSWSAWTLLLTPATILLHEFGHLLAALFLGVPQPELHFSHISHGDLAATPSWVLGVVAFTGPLITVGLILVGMMWVHQRRPTVWAFALVFAAASRLFVAVPHTMITSVRWLRGEPLSEAGFDEYKGAVALGWPGDLPLVFTSLFFIASMVWLGRLLPRGRRSTAWSGLVLGTVLGWSLWMIVVGPVVLP